MRESGLPYFSIQETDSSTSSIYEAPVESNMGFSKLTDMLYEGLVIHI